MSGWRSTGLRRLEHEPIANPCAPVGFRESSASRLRSPRRCGLISLNLPDRLDDRCNAGLVHEVESFQLFLAGDGARVEQSPDYQHPPVHSASGDCSEPPVQAAGAHGLVPLFARLCHCAPVHRIVQPTIQMNVPPVHDLQQNRFQVLSFAG